VTARRIGPAIVAVVAIVVLVGVALVALARPAPSTETGVVIAIDSAGLTDVRGFTIRTADGRQVTFAIGALENGAQFPPGHLAEHQATAQPIRVFYRDEDGRLVAFRLEDAPPG
jgi:hypothetical protein